MRNKIIFCILTSGRLPGDGSSLAYDQSLELWNTSFQVTYSDYID